MNGKVSSTENQLYRGILWESVDELAFLQWVGELQDAGYVTSIHRARSYDLSSPAIHEYSISLKTKTKPKTQLLLHGHQYTPEFLIAWDQQSRGIFYQDISDNSKLVCPIIAHEDHSLIEIKPNFDHQNMERLFRINQKWMWRSYNLYVNLIKPHMLFPATFTPMAYLQTKTGKDKKIKWKPRTLEEFLKLQENVI